jgi:hypothetical protein
MANVVPGFVFSETTPINHTNLNLAAQPTVSIGAGEITNSNLNSSGGIGYVVGTGGSVTQATSKSTTVEINKPTGEVVMNGAALNTATTVSFIMTNSTIAATDVMIINHVTMGTFGSYTFNSRCGSGAANIEVRNISGGSLSEEIVLRYALIKGSVT